MHQHHLRDEFARYFREVLFPQDRRRVRAAKDGDGGAGGEVAFFSLVLLADAGKVIRCDDGFQSIGEIAHVPGMVDLGGCIHQVIHDRIGDRQKLLFAHGFKVQGHVFQRECRFFIPRC